MRFSRVSGTRCQDISRASEPVVVEGESGGIEERWQRFEICSQISGQTNQKGSAMDPIPIILELYLAHHLDEAIPDSSGTLRAARVLG